MIKHYPCERALTMGISHPYGGSSGHRIKMDYISLNSSKCYWLASGTLWMMEPHCLGPFSSLQLLPMSFKSAMLMLVPLTMCDPLPHTHFSVATNPTRFDRWHCSSVTLQHCNTTHKRPSRIVSREKEFCDNLVSYGTGNFSKQKFGESKSGRTNIKNYFLVLSQVFWRTRCLCSN